MHTKISSDNPYGHDRWGFAWEYVPGGADAHLDFGCHDGAFLAKLGGKGIERLVGIDISKDAVEKGRSQFANLELIHVSQSVPLPFPDGLFTSVTILDVIEHVYEQTAVLEELNRVLKDNGRLIVTIPGKHIFSFLDTGNLKLRFPKLHRWCYCRTHSKQEYEYRYVSNPDGLVGDISTKKRWHEHFSRTKLEKLLNESGFKVIEFDGTGFFCRVIGIVDCLFQWIKPIDQACNAIGSLDRKLFESANLFCVAEKL